MYVRDAAYPLTVGITDPNAVTWRSSREAERETPSVRRPGIGSVSIKDTAQKMIRERVRNTESSAAKAARKTERAAKLAGSKGDLYQGRYLHGSMDSSLGAAGRGCPCAKCEAARANEMSARRIIADAVRKIYAAYQQIEKMEWSWSLLNTSFALGDRTSVSWADATVEDHERYIELVEKKMLGGLQTLSRHESAIDVLVTTGARNLREAIAKGYTT